MLKVYFVLCYFLVVSVNSQQSTKITLYNSSDLSYLSNGIQFPVPAQLEADAVQNDDKIPDIKWLTTLFDHHQWEKRLDVVKNKKCAEEMKIYIDNLKNGTTWAIKSQYFFKFFFS